MNNKLKKIAFIYILPLVFSCGDNENNTKEDQPDQTALLQNVGENLIVKGYADFNTKASGLLQSAQAFTNDGMENNLSALRDKWVKAYKSWQKVAIYNFGPAANNAIITINSYPTDTALIHDNISGGPDSYNLSTAGSTFAKGFPALDYLLFGFAENDAAIVDKFNNSENAKTYLVDVVKDIANLAETVHNNWKEDGNNYIGTFTSNTGTSKGSSLSQLVNAWSQYMEKHVRDAKIGTPNGNSVASSERFGPFPEKAEAYYSKNYSLELGKTAVKALKDFYMGIDSDGNDGEGLYDYLNKINAQDGTLADDFKAQFDASLNNLDKLNEPFTDAILNQGDEVTAVFNSLKAVVALLKVDVVSALSISITYADNDGD